MASENDIITRYVDDVIYDPEHAYLDVASLSDEYQRLGQSIARLGAWVIEANADAAALARREWIASSATHEGNVFAGNIEKIRLMLEDMTDQIHQIVGAPEGHSDDQGAAAPDFDFMVGELRRRTSALENERNLFITFTESASERIVVLDEETGDFLFGNKVARDFFERHRDYVDDAHTMNSLSGCTAENPYTEWTHTVVRPDGAGGMMTEHFGVHSIYIIWEKRGAVAHMFSNVTEFRKIQDLATKDPLTGLHNRAFAMDWLEASARRTDALVVAFIDIDYLKYCNDELGHAAGDDYLLQVARILEGLPCTCEVCRTGGDEFLVMTESASVDDLTSALEHARTDLAQQPFSADPSSPHRSFSFGIASAAEEGMTDVSAMLAVADERMYANKLENKRTNHVAVHDDRL